MPSLNSRAALLTILSRWAVAGFALAELLFEAAFFRVSLCTIEDYVNKADLIFTIENRIPLSFSHKLLP